MAGIPANSGGVIMAAGKGIPARSVGNPSVGESQNRFALVFSVRGWVTTL
jgi:hypothetical protein